eukprot:m.3334 g.3334  ORF g.3334 m.3334 type:complete len:88 (-) comp2750_c0_seq1:65-328(-)
MDGDLGITMFCCLMLLQQEHPGACPVLNEWLRVPNIRPTGAFTSNEKTREEEDNILLYVGETTSTSYNKQQFRLQLFINNLLISKLK